MVKCVVVVKCVLKFVVKFKHCQIETKIGVVVDIDSPITIVVCGKIYGKICSKIVVKICGKIEQMLDLWLKNNLGVEGGGGVKNTNKQKQTKYIGLPDFRTRESAAPTVLVS